jgi:hypothetical protein
MRKEYVVFNQRLAGFLMMNGFVLKRLDKSKHNGSNRNVFIFNDSENLIKTIDTYKVEYLCMK